MRRRFYLERLEERTLLSQGDTLADAIPVAGSAAALMGSLATTHDVELYALNLAQGDAVTAAVAAQSKGSALDALLRVFDGTGAQIAFTNNLSGVDPQLAFQTPGAGTYYVGVSAAGNDSYDPRVAQSGAGLTQGPFELDLSVTHRPDLVGTAFHIGGGPVRWGDTVTINYTIANHGGADVTTPFQTALLLATNSRFNGTGADLALPPQITISSLAAGTAADGTVTVPLPGAPGKPPSGFAEPAQVFLGLRIDSGNVVQESNKANNSGQGQGRDFDAVDVLSLQAGNNTTGPANDTFASAANLPLNSWTAGSLGSGDVAFYRVQVTQPGRFTAQVHAPGLGTRLSLFDANQNLLIQSDGQSPADPDNLIVQHLDSSPYGFATYYLEVEGRGTGSGNYALTNEFVPSGLPPDELPSSLNDHRVVTGDFNGDGIPDLVFASDAGYSVLLGLGDGTFRNAGNNNLGQGNFSNAFAMVAGDFNGDGHLDLAIADSDNTVDVFLGQGDGTFRKAGQTIQVGLGSGGVIRGLAAGDFSGTGMPDLAVASQLSNVVSIYQGRGDGTFQYVSQINTEVAFDVGLATGDFTGDGRQGLAITDSNAGTVSVFASQEDGTFRKVNKYATGSGADGIVTADFNGDGRPDLAITNSGAGTVSVLVGLGNGEFHDPVQYDGGLDPSAIVAGDLNGDGKTDLVISHSRAFQVSVLLGAGDGTFQPSGLTFFASAGQHPADLVLADFNGDGHLDVATSQGSVLPGAGDGTFMTDTSQVQLQVEKRPTAVVSGDFNGDGHPDLAVVNTESNSLSVFLGEGDGTFRSAGVYQLGPPPSFLAGASFNSAVVTGDFNNDGRLDLAIANPGSPFISTLLGLGDGTFRDGGHIDTGGTVLTSLATGDFDEDGNPDIAASDGSVYLGDGTGGFRKAEQPYGTGTHQAIAVGDFTGAGHLDIATSDGSVYLGNGDGTFRQTGQQVLRTFGTATGIVTGDFSGNGHPGLAITTQFVGGFGGVVHVFEGLGDGTFQTIGNYSETNGIPTGVVAGDVNGDGNLDIVTSDGTVLLGDGKGQFTSPPVSFPVPGAGGGTSALALADLNGDDHPDLALVHPLVDGVVVNLGRGDGTFVSAGQVSTAIPSAPLVADFTGDGVPDVAVLRQDGRILLRRGRANEPGVFDPPVLVNPAPAFPARDSAVVFTNGQFVLAALDANDSGVSLYSFDPTAVDPAKLFIRTAGPSLPPGILPARIAAGDLNGDGHDDLVVTAAGSNQVYVYLQDSTGDFALLPNGPLGVGASPLAIALAARKDDHRLDILVANQFSGDVSLLVNDPSNPFATERRFRAGSGPYGLGQQSHTNPFATVQSQEGTVAVVAGPFSGAEATDLVAINSGSRTASVLLGDGTGGVFNPQPGLELPAGVKPIAVVAGRFEQGNPHLNFAVLDQASHRILVFSNNGAGRFTPISSADAGTSPTGLSVADVTGPNGGAPDGIPDLLVGNAFGDVLVLAGLGNGSFEAPQQPDPHTRKIALTVAADNHFILGNSAQDRVVVQNGIDGASTVVQDRSSGILAPGKPNIADVGGSQYLVVPNSGANEVRVYPLVNGQPDATHVQTFPVGTDPVGITIADVNNDGIPDVVVANQGSNDVSILLGQGQGPNWTLVGGPRLHVGQGPVSTALITVNGTQELAVANSQSNDVWLLPSRGNGFFSDQPADVRVMPTGTGPLDLIAGTFDNRPGPELLTVNAGSNDLTLIANLSGTATETTLGAGVSAPDVVLAFANGAFTDLVLGDDGGAFALLLGGPNGLRSPESLLIPSFLHPSDLALAELGNGTLDLFATQEGVEAVRLLAFNLEASAAVTGPPGSPNTPFVPGLDSGGQRPQIAELVSLEMGTVAVVAILVTGTADVEAVIGGSNGFADVFKVAAVAPGAPLNVVADGTGGEPEHDRKLPPDIPFGETTLSNFLLGLEKALEKLDQASPGPGGSPNPTALPDGPARLVPEPGKPPVMVNMPGVPGPGSEPLPHGPPRPETALAVKDRDASEVDGGAAAEVEPVATSPADFPRGRQQTAPFSNRTVSGPAAKPVLGADSYPTPIAWDAPGEDATGFGPLAAVLLAAGLCPAPADTGAKDRKMAPESPPQRLALIRGPR